MTGFCSRYESENKRSALQDASSTYACRLANAHTCQYGGGPASTRSRWSCAVQRKCGLFSICVCGRPSVQPKFPGDTRVHGCGCLTLSLSEDKIFFNDAHGKNSSSAQNVHSYVSHLAQERQKRTGNLCPRPVHCRSKHVASQHYIGSSPAPR